MQDSTEKKKQVLRCSAYSHYTARHRKTIDPADHRCGKTGTTGCNAHININRVGDSNVWTITTADYGHNHPRTIPIGAPALRPPTADERRIIAQFATDHTFSRHHRNDPRWTYAILVDDDGKVSGLFWQSPEQVRLAQQFSDILLNDNAANRNQYQFALNIGVIIDGCGSSRNVFYALHEREDIDSHFWVFDQYLQSTGNLSPEALFCDRHPSVIGSAIRRMPTTARFYCLNHLGGNISDKLLPHLRHEWKSFASAFWHVYYAPSPEDDNIYPIRQHWAWAWVSTSFTAGTRTTGRVESENRVNKTLGGPTVTVKQLFDKLNLRTSAQTAKQTMHHSQNSRRHHETNLESYFRQPLRLLRDHAGPFAMQTSYDQMENSLFYNVEVLRLPPGHRVWVRTLPMVHT
ncbi:hypothetical protein EXIGLDRAFT_616487 [Exidia glandulosa HHB12029]|uniref:Uncharacterized protein n=1 Tax=Exidia glandulosa HHB12029 TaxID=1314781 RepID=A0A165GNH1_EXIGL|nr:hypothetical protein EXIGLDRAFT_616487 [Exidia glandulosa HHB12029]